MAKFLSNDRKVILLSAITGTLLIAILSRVLFIDNMFIWFLGGTALLAIYWYIPTWFSRNRQLVEDNEKLFNADGKEVTKESSPKKLILILLFFVINAFLLLFAYDTIFKILVRHYPNHKNHIIDIAVVLYLITPYLIRHIYCFIRNIPMDTSFRFQSKNTLYLTKSFSHSSRLSKELTSPEYSSLTGNIYNHKKY